MVTQYEAAKLQRDMRHELDGSTGAVEKCAGAMALLALIAVIGASWVREAPAIEAAVPGVVAGYEVTPPPPDAE